MTELGEGMSMVLSEMESPEKCEYPPPSGGWKCKLDGESSVLASNITRDLGIAKPTAATEESQLTSDCWPSQAHHLIPWQQLKGHPVCGWLTTAPQKGPERLIDNNDYSVDHGHNGKFMPYASALNEWATGSPGKKKKLANKVMRLAKIQLHQGKHSFKPYGVGEAGYKTRVDEYLEKIKDNCIAHTKNCKDCKAKKDADKIPARRNLVRFVDTASFALDHDINGSRIFVSRRAAEYVAAFGSFAEE